MAASTSSPMPLTFRQYTTLTKTDLPQGRIVEYTSSSPRASTMVEEVPTNTRDSNLYGCRNRPKHWLSTSGLHTTTSDRKKRLENLTLGRDTRRGSRASTTPKTNSSSRRSDSATNDSQRSALTSESLEDRRTQSSNDFNIVMKTRDDPDASEDELEKRKNYEKCMNWIERLPVKFSGMHIAQERAPKTTD